MNRLPPALKRNDAHPALGDSGGRAWRRLGRGLRRLHGLAYVAVAAGAMAAAGLQPPHTAAVEVGTVMVATAAGGELAWPSAAPASR
jgi:hypothetical protein